LVEERQIIDAEFTVVSEAMPPRPVHYRRRLRDPMWWLAFAMTWGLYFAVVAAIVISVLVWPPK
jgi:uncharacterized protein involved in exopolysaccharide biosynthesis